MFEKLMIVVLTIFASVSISIVGYDYAQKKMTETNHVQIQTLPNPQSLPLITFQSVNSTPAKGPTENVEVIHLTEDNTVIMDEVFNDQSVTRVMMELQKLSDTQPRGATVYLVLNSPGGSVDAGLRLISFAKALPLKIKTLTLFAASMGFQTAQQLDERLILDTGTLMSHRAKFGISGEAPGELFTRLKYFMHIIDSLDVIASRRMGMTFDAYRDMIKDEYWVFGQQAIKDRAADRIVLAKCGKGLDKTRIVEIETFFGTFKVQMSKCPLIPGFLPMQAPEGQEQAMGYIQTLFLDKTKFVNDYIKTNRWLEYQK